MSSAPESNRDGPPALSVILPFRNDARHLPRQLEAPAQQELPDRWEVVAVDDRSTDGSRAIAERFTGRLEIRVIASDGRGPAHARNVGARLALGRRLVFVDADDEVAPGYLAATADGLERFSFVTSAFDNRALNAPWLAAAHRLQSRDPADPLPRLFGLLPTAGGSIGVSREAFEHAGGFPEEFGAAEDVAFSWNVQLAGFDLGYAAEAILRLRYRRSLRALFVQTFRWGSALPALYRRYRPVGMEPRPLGRAVRLWLELAHGLASARTRADLAPQVVRAGLLLGRLAGSVRHRTPYL